MIRAGPARYDSIRNLAHELISPDESLSMCANGTPQGYPGYPHACQECERKKESLSKSCQRVRDGILEPHQMEAGK